MKKLLLTASLGLLSFPAISQTTEDSNFSMLYTSHACDTYQNIVSWVENEFSEKLLLRGIGTAVYEDSTSYGELDGVMQYFVNQDTGTWTMIYVFEINKVCIMATGTNFQPYSE